MRQNPFGIALILLLLLSVPALCVAQTETDPAQAMSPPAAAPKPAPTAEPAAAIAPEVQAPTEAAAAEDPASEPPPASPPTYAPAPYYPQPAPSEAPAAGPASIQYGPGPIAVGEPTPVAAPGAREHDGFFLRVSVGVGAGFTSYREYVGQAETTVKTAGVVGQLELALGGRVIGNLLLHGNLLLSGMDDARKTVSEVRDASNTIGTSFAMLGGGATYYFMPANAYVSGMLGVAGMSETRDEQLSVESGAGLGGALTLGKEWWVGRSSEWGVGAALRGAMIAAPVQIAGVESTMRGSQVTIAFSATLN